MNKTIGVLCFCLLAAPLGAQEGARQEKKGFWIFSFSQKPSPPKDEMRERVHSLQKLQVFDYITVFQLESEMKAYAEEAYALKNRHMEREKLIVQERISLVDELDALILDQKAGKDRKNELLRSYKKLYVNSKKMQELGQEHAADLQKLSQHIYQEYTNKTESRMALFEKNPQELADLLIKIHDKTKGNR